MRTGRRVRARWGCLVAGGYVSKDGCMDVRVLIGGHCPAKVLSAFCLVLFFPCLFVPRTHERASFWEPPLPPPRLHPALSCVLFFFKSLSSQSHFQPLCPSHCLRYFSSTDFLLTPSLHSLHLHPPPFTYFSPFHLFFFHFLSCLFPPLPASLPSPSSIHLSLCAAGGHPNNAPPSCPPPAPLLEHSDTDTWHYSAWLPSLRPALVPLPLPLSPPLSFVRPVFAHSFLPFLSFLYIIPLFHLSFSWRFSFFSLLAAPFLSLVHSIFLAPSPSLCLLRTHSPLSPSLFLLSFSSPLPFLLSLVRSLALGHTMPLSQPINTGSASTFYVTTLRRMIISRFPSERERAREKETENEEREGRGKKDGKTERGGNSYFLSHRLLLARPSLPPPCQFSCQKHKQKRNGIFRPFHF